MVRRTYYLPRDVVTDLDRAVVAAQASAYVERAPGKADVIAAVIRAGLAAMPEVLETLRARAGSTTSLDASTTRQHGWQRPIALPDSLDELRGPTEGVVRLPLAVHASGSGPREEFDLSRPEMRAAMYQVLLREGVLADLRRFINGRELRAIWPRLWLPRHVRQEWSDRFPDLAA